MALEGRDILLLWSCWRRERESLRGGLVEGSCVLETSVDS